VKTVVIGVGNVYRRDDGAGVAVAEALRPRVPAGVDVVACENEPSRLLDAWEGADAVFVVDAVSSGGTPGALHRFDAAVTALPAGVFRSSTHAFGVGDTIELGRALGRLPSYVVVYGIEASDFTSGEQLTPAVAAALDGVVDTLLAEIEEVTCTSAR